MPRGKNIPRRESSKGIQSTLRQKPNFNFSHAKITVAKLADLLFMKQSWGKVLLVVRDYTDHDYHQIKRLALTRCVDDPFVLISSENVFNGVTSGWSLGHACDLVLKKCMYVNYWNFRKICISPFQISFVKRDGYILKSHTILTIFLE